MKKRYIHTLFIALAPLTMCAEEMNDSIFAEEELQQVVVTGTRTPKLLKNTPVLTRVISSRDIKNADATNLRDLLQQVVPGVEFSYAINQLVHMNFSGFGGQSMLILVDGERLAGETMDDVDFARLTMDNVDHIEIVKGAASALYGSSAAGGVINIITKKAVEPFKLNLNARFARHNEQRYGLSWQQAGSKLSNLFTVNRNGMDNYDVKSAENPVTRVFSTIYGDKTWNFRDQLVYKPWEDMKLTGRAGYFFRELVRTVDSPERYRDFNGGLRAEWKLSENDDIDASYSFDQYDKSDYQKITGLDVRDYSNVQNSFRMLYSHRFNNDVFTAGADFMHDYLFNTKLEGKNHSQDSFDAFMQYDWNLHEHWEIVSAIRYDYFSDNNTQRVTPKFSIRHTPLKNLNVRFGYGMGFRAPSLKEKYYEFDMAGIWNLVGDKNLKPEVSQNYNFSIDYTKGHYNFTVNAYCNEIKNKISTGIPYFANPNDDKPSLPYVNIADYIVAGFEATAQARWDCGVSARLAYAYTHEQLPKSKDGEDVNNMYVPARSHSLNAHIDWNHRFNKHYAFDIALDGRVLSGVDNLEYVDYYDISKGTVSLHYPAYTIWKFTTSHQIGKHIKVTLAIDNLLNYKPKYYYLNCPLTDGANVMAGVSVDL